MAERADFDYSIQETIKGRTVTYDAAGNVLRRNFSPDQEGPVSELLFRRRGEAETRIRHVNTQGIDTIHIQVDMGVDVCNYFVHVTYQTWDRVCAGSTARGDVQDLEIKLDDAGEDWLPVQWAIISSQGVALEAGASSCTYRFNRLTQRWERICT